MNIIVKAHKLEGVNFIGNPKYIHIDAYLDPIGGLVIGNNVVISTGVIILTHDYSYTTGLITINKKPLSDIAILGKVTIGVNCFIGARAIILPGSKIGSNVIISAGSVVKGTVKSNSVMVGNPAIKIWNTDDWGEFLLKNISTKKTLIDKK